MNNKEIKFIAEVGIFAAVGLVLDFLAGLYSSFAWPNGGSVSFAMVPIFMMAYRWGLKGGLSTGIIIGLIQILWSSGSARVHIVQIFLDYPIAYGVVGLAGLYAKKIFNAKDVSKLYYITMGILIAGGLRTLIHIISGVIFFSSADIPILPAFVASTVYNLGYMVPSIILCLIVVVNLVKTKPDLVLKVE